MTQVYLPAKDNIVAFSNLLSSSQNKNPVSFARGFWSKLLGGNKSESQLRTRYEQQTRKKTKQFGLCDMGKGTSQETEKKTCKIKTFECASETEMAKNCV